MSLVIDLNTVFAGVAVILLGALIVGAFGVNSRFTKLEAEFRAFRHEVLRFMENHQGGN